MGQLTCIVMVGFLAIHVAVILNIIAVATPNWLEGDVNSTSNKNHTGNRTVMNKGLWEVCNADKSSCRQVNETQQSAYFKAVQALDTVGTGVTVLSLVLVYAFLLFNRCRDSQGLSSINVFLQVLAGFILLTTTIIFGVQGRTNKSGDFPEDYLVKFGWSYYVAVVGMVITFVSAGAATRECRAGAFRPREYESF